MMEIFKNMDKAIKQLDNLLLKPIDIKSIDMGSIDIDNINNSDYPDFCDAMIVEAFFNDGTELSDEQLNQLMDEHDGLVNELIHENQLYL